MLLVTKSDSVTPRTAAPGFPALHYLPECTQAHVHWVADAIQPIHPLSPPSPPALNLSQDQGLFQWVGCSQQVAKALASASVLPMNIQGWFPLGLTGLISLLSEGLSRVFSSSTSWKHQFFSLLYGLTLTSVHDYWKRQISHITYMWKQTNKQNVTNELTYSYSCWTGISVCSPTLSWTEPIFRTPRLLVENLPLSRSCLQLYCRPPLCKVSYQGFLSVPTGSLSYGDTPGSCSKLLIRQFSSWPLL